MEAIAYRISRKSDGEVLFEGIVNNIEDTICPAQQEPHLKEEFPDLPYECELCKFKVDGLYVETLLFDISWEDVMARAIS